VLAISLFLLEMLVIERVELILGIFSKVYHFNMMFYLIGDWKNSGKK
jgi:hypothetical protein